MNQQNEEILKGTAAPGVLASSQINQIAAALAKAQGEMAVPEKKRTATVRMKEEKGGGTYTYKYADLSDIRTAITPALSKNELAVAQTIDAQTVRLTTLLIHSSGQFLGSTYDLPRGLPAQQFGSALTYAKRYSLCSLLGVVADEDDDAQITQQHTQRAARNAKPASSSVIPKPKAVPNQAAGGTSGPALPAAPANMTRAEIDTRISDAYRVLVKLNPQLDLAAAMYGRYGVGLRKDLQTDEAWDFLQFMETEIGKGESA